MALTVSATNTELPRPVNTVFQQTLLRNAKVRCPYFLGTVPGELSTHMGSQNVAWRRINNLSSATGGLSELQGSAAYMQGRSAAALSVTAYTAVAAKYGNFVILNEEADLYNFNGQTDKIFEVIGINYGQSINQLQRNIVEDNATLIYAGGATSDAAVTSSITVASIKLAMNTLDKNSTVTFNPMSPATGDMASGGNGLMPSYWAICHPDLAVDVTGLSGFIAAERYAGNVSLAMSEFGAMTVAGRTVRFISTEDASIDADSGGTNTSSAWNGTSDIDLYTMPIYGQDAIGSVGFGDRYSDGTFMAGDTLGPVSIIAHGLGSGGTSDPYNEIQTIAWKAWHTGAILNASWVRAIRCGVTSLS